MEAGIWPRLDCRRNLGELIPYRKTASLLLEDKGLYLQFNEKKATQAAARFLRQSGGHMNYMKLIKLLYLADRGAFLRWGRPISGDKYFLMRLGPVLSEVHDLITEVPCPDERTFWRDYISSPSEYEVQLKQDPGNDELSRAEEGLIDEVFAAYGHYEPFALVEFLHRTLPEWKEIKSGRLPLEYREILQLGGMPAEAIEEIESELDSLRLVSSMHHTG